MLGELIPDEIEDLLRSEILGRIGCVADGWPYVVPVIYAYDGESVYFHSAEGRKVRAMRENPHVCFEVEKIRSTTDWNTVVARGRFESTWRDADNSAMNLLATRHASSSVSAHLERNDQARRQGVRRPFIGEQFAVVYCIRLLEKTGRFLRT